MREIRSDSPLEGFTIKKYYTETKSFEDLVTFNEQFCYFPSKVTCDVTDDTGHLTITNNGPPDICIIVFEMLGQFYCINDGEGGCWDVYLETGQSAEVGVIANFQCADWPESQTILLTFITGYVVNENEMTPTDYLAYDVYIYHPKVDWTMIAIIGGIAVGVGIMALSLLKKPRPMMIGGPNAKRQQ